jgi:WhiB family redox-sensing transcriptional regulator
VSDHGISDRGRRDDWMGDAACRHYPPELWAADERLVGDNRLEEAKTICNGNHRVPRCPVREPCLEHAFANDERDGVWGGMSALERSKLRGGQVA